MKRLNIIFIAEENQQQVAQTSVLDTLQTVDVSEQVALLNSMLNENPSLAEDDGIKQLLQTSELVKQEEASAGAATPETEIKPSQQQSQQGGNDEKKTDKSPLSSLPFFKEDDSSSTKFDLKTLTPENFHEFAKSLGVEPTGDTWVGDAIQKAAEQISAPLSKFEEEYNALKSDIEGLPKEVHTIVNLALEGKDWKSAVGGAATLDLSKDFASLSADEKIKIHNYYFPEDQIKSGDDVTSKENAKALKAAEAQYRADKTSYELKVSKDTADAKARQQNFLSSVDVSIAELKKEYPDFKEKDLKAAEEIVKKGGIYNLYFDKNGNLRPDGFKKLIFAQHGENILKVATSIAENRGKNKGKNEVLSVEQGVDKSNNNGATELTNVEKTVNKLVHESSMSGSQLTY